MLKDATNMLKDVTKSRNCKYSGEIKLRLFLIIMGVIVYD